MANYAIELRLEDNPAALLQALGLQTKQFEKVKEAIFTRIMADPSLQMIVLEFRRGEGLFYGEVKYGQSDDYQQARTERSKIIGQSRGRDQTRPKEPETGGDDGISDSEENRTGWGLEQLLHSQLTALRP